MRTVAPPHRLLEAMSVQQAEFPGKTVMNLKSLRTRAQPYVIALLCAASSASHAALFGFSPTHDTIWESLSSALWVGFSPSDLMLVAMLVHARRCGSLR